MLTCTNSKAFDGDDFHERPTLVLPLDSYLAAVRSFFF
jgi:hypothetical protein